MNFEEVIIEGETKYIQDEGLFEDVDWMGIDAFHKYWMDIADPRRTYLDTLESFLFEQASGSGEWDY